MTSNNRNPVKQWFLTFPQTPVTKHEFRDALLPLKPEFYHIVQETHKDGGFHLHACVKLVGGYSKPYLLKHFKATFPDTYKRIDFKPVRSMKHALAYLSKEDTEPLFNKTWTPTRGNNMQLVARRANFRRTLLMLEKGHTGWIEAYTEHLFKVKGIPIPDPPPSLNELVIMSVREIEDLPSTSLEKQF